MRDTSILILEISVFSVPNVWRISRSRSRLFGLDSELEVGISTLSQIFMGRENNSLFCGILAEVKDHDSRANESFSILFV